MPLDGSAVGMPNYMTGNAPVQARTSDQTLNDFPGVNGCWVQYALVARGYPFTIIITA